MIKKNIKKISIWLIILSVSIALIISNFAFYNSYKDVKNKIKINGYDVSENDIENLTKQILFEKKYLNEIDYINNKVKSIIKKNIFFNIFLMRSGFIITNKELLHTILSINRFNINNTFSEEIYKNYLKNKGLTEIVFQEEIKKISIQNKLKYYLKFINDNNYENYYNIYYKIYPIKKNIKHFHNNNKLKEFVINDTKFIKYINLSVKNILYNIKINKDKIFYYKDKFINNFSKYNFIKLKEINLDKNQTIFNLILSENEFKNKKIQHFYTKNKLIKIGNKYFEIINNKDKKCNYSTNDIYNKYKKQKAYNYIKKNNKNLLYKKIENVSKLLNLNINVTDKINHKFFLNTKFDINFSSSFKLNKMSYLFFKVEKNNLLKTTNEINIFINNYINKINQEKLILKKFLYEKKNIYKNKFVWKNIFCCDARNNISVKLNRLIKNKNEKYIILKYKNKYYIVKKSNKLNNIYNNNYIRIKKMINAKT